MKEERIDSLERYIIEKKSASLDHLCEVFNISKVTLRRDLDKLVARGNVKKVYGGVVAVEGNEEKNLGTIAYATRNSERIDEKRLVSKLAADTVNDNDVIFIDSGTTIHYMPDYMKDKKNVTVITYSIPVAVKLMSMSNIRTIIMPGMVREDTESIVGSSSVSYLQKWHVHKAYMSCSAVNESGVFNSEPEEHEIKRTAMGICQKSFLLTDVSKFDGTSLMSYSGLSDFDVVITNGEPDEKYREILAAHNVINLNCETDL